jgi:Iap family predicted aminopeptidase
MTDVSTQAPFAPQLAPGEIAARIERICACGNRYVGTPGEAQARESILAMFLEAGLEEVRVEEHAVVACIPKEPLCQLEDGTLGFRATALQFTAAGRAEGEIAYLGSATRAELDRAWEHGVDVRGRIAVAHSYWPFEFAQELVERGAVGIVILSDAPGGQIPHFTARMYPPGDPYPIPGVVVERTDGRALLAALAGQRRRLVVEHASEYERAWTGNVLGEIPGDSRPAERVVIGAHYDTQLAGMGACDNASGVATLAEIAAAWRRQPGPARTVVFVAFADEEHGFQGAIDYCTRHSDELARTVGMVNLDALGWLLPGERSVHADPSIRSLAFECAAAVGWGPQNELEASLMQASDHNAFIDAGVPACFFWHYPPQHPYYHAEGDSLELVSPTAVAAAGTAAASTAWVLANRPELTLGRSQPAIRRLDLRPAAQTT